MGEMGRMGRMFNVTTSVVLLLVRSNDFSRFRIQRLQALFPV
jgi:hypothetical protein